MWRWLPLLPAQSPIRAQKPSRSLPLFVRSERLPLQGALLAGASWPPPGASGLARRLRDSSLQVAVPIRQLRTCLEMGATLSPLSLRLVQVCLLATPRQNTVVRQITGTAPYEPVMIAKRERSGRQPQDFAGQRPALDQTTGPSLQTMIGLCAVIVNSNTGSAAEVASAVRQIH